MASKPSIGGQAVMEGVMMRGPVSWAVAVRKPSSEIAVETHQITGPRHGIWKLPFFRGIFVLVESLGIGMRALRISANYALEEEDSDKQVPEKAIGWSMGVAIVFFSAIFIAIPAILSKLGGKWLGVHSTFLKDVVEGAIRIGFFLGYIFAISFIPDIKRVFQYHGAEHKTIYAYENDDPLEPEVVDRYTTLHVRCGTNFLFIVMFLTIIFHFGLDLLLHGQKIYVLVAARVLLIPLLAGSSYEVIRAAGKNEDSKIFRIASLPGLALQKVTTKPPTHEQIEVAIKAMEAVIARQSIVEPAQAAETMTVKQLDSSVPEGTVPEPGPAPG
ncbi:MAG: DUF1385 domain-containing protein [Actinomycetota bacterium]|nr:DUF1385 domain-containing protein [Actinomycetota bacterium]